MKGLFKFFLLFLTVSSVFGAPNFNSGAEFTIEEPIEITDGYKIKASIKFRSNEKICTVLNAYFGNVNSSLDRIGHINLSKCTKNSSTNKIEIEVESFGNQRLSCKSISSIVFDFSDIKLWKILKDSYRMEEAQAFVYALFYRLGFQVYYSLNYNRSSRYSRLRFTGQISAETCLYE